MGKAKMFSENKFDEAKAAQAFPNGLGEILSFSHGGFVLSPGKTPNASQVAMLANQTQRFFINQTRLGIPVLFLEEALHGLMVKDGTNFPSSLGMASSWNEQLTSQVFEAIAREARAVGTHRVLAPILDLALDPRWGRTEETMGEDPYLTTRLGLAKVKALQGNTDKPDSAHVAASLKHLGAHGQPEGGVNKGPVFVSERWLREVNFKPFKAAIVDGKALGVMPNYNEISGVPTHADKWMLTDVLRGEWGFKGLVISDLGAVAQLMTLHRVTSDSAETGAKAVNAGVDIELTDDKAMIDHLSRAVKSGYTSPAAIDKAVLHVLQQKLLLGLFERPYIDEGLTDIVGSVAHRALALSAARQSIVLLKNDGGVLPLDRKKYRRIAVIGPNADQCILGGYSQIPRATVSPLQAIKEKYPDIELIYAKGVRLTTSGENFRPTRFESRQENVRLIQQAVNAARNADAILLMLGGNDVISREAVSPYSPGDLADLELLGEQNELIDSLKTLRKPTAAFVFSGPPISFAHLQKTVPAIAQCWYLGQETGYAVAETIFGDNNPSGKLPISIAHSAGHLPAYYFAKPSAREVPYNADGVTPALPVKPMYPFGFGMSYTSYQYSNLRLSKSAILPGENVTVTIDVKNSGARKGEEIVQLYIRDVVSSVTRPITELKDFQRIALAPGETRQASFTVTPDKLSFYNIDLKEVIEPGDFEIMVGPSSQKHEVVKLTVNKKSAAYHK
jgi:beta-glucosidase